jgi:4-hydroxybenzoate polyprenyltransferase
MDSKVIAIIKTVRPRQWLKNLAIYAGLVFSGRLFELDDFLLVSAAFLLFSFVASAIYIFNDLVDAPADRLHPFKKNRPIASGLLATSVAFGLAVALLFSGLLGAFVLSPRFFMTVVAYLLLQLLYMFLLKHVIILDVIAIASGFLLRIYAGLWLIGAHLNIWFLLCVVSFALFVATGKRRAEATLLQGYFARKKIGAVRATLSHYPESLLLGYTTMFATATWLTYALFTFEQPPFTPNKTYREFLDFVLPRVYSVKWLMLTIPFVIYGVMRYLYLIYEQREGESPERILLADRPLLTAVIGWALMVILILYVISG